MADVARLALTRALLEGTLSPFLDRGVTAAMFPDPETQGVYQFVVTHFQQHRALPSSQLIQQQFPAVVLPVQAPDALSYYVDTLVKDWTRKEAVEALLKQAPALAGRGSATGALDQLRKTFVALSAMEYGQRDKTLEESVDEWLADYEDRQQNVGLRGIPTGWSTLDDLTEGWQPEMYAGFVARPGKGKTHAMLRMGLAAFADGRSVLFVNKELSDALMNRRFIAHYAKLGYERFRKGMLTQAEEARLQQLSADLKANPPGKWQWLHNVRSVSGIAAKIEQVQPDIVFIDGAYLLVDEEGGRQFWERYTNISRGLKRLMQQYKIPAIISIQLSRAGDSEKWGKAPTLSDVMGADAFAQDVDFLFALEQSAEMRKRQEMKLLPLKCREADPSLAVLLAWDFENMDFGDRGLATQVVAKADAEQETLDFDD